MILPECVSVLSYLLIFFIEHEGVSSSRKIVASLSLPLFSHLPMK
jgi:hypothetical protein